MLHQAASKIADNGAWYLVETIDSMLLGEDQVTIMLEVCWLLDKDLLAWFKFSMNEGSSNVSPGRT